MDIAKYITTAVLLTSVFSSIDNGWIVYVCSSVAIALNFGKWPLAA